MLSVGHYCWRSIFSVRYYTTQTRLHYNDMLSFLSYRHPGCSRLQYTTCSKHRVKIVFLCQRNFVYSASLCFRYVVFCCNANIFCNDIITTDSNQNDISVCRNGLPYTFCAQIDFFCIFGTLRVQAVPKWLGYNFHAPGSPPKLHNSKMAAKNLSSPISLLIEVRFE